ncbi:UDP-N-acetylmuramate dehydrogenase [Candidatus Saccharibacteria bacterium]|nr:UDP-N-acetylmuramate dehydrogenase [Candidatus Saccharibacteria bacterium]
MKIQENIPLSSITTMRLGGPADYVIDIESSDEAVEAIEFAEQKNLPVYFLGTGANSLGLDEGFHGVIIRNHIKGFETISETSDELVVRVGGGEIWDDFVEFVVSKGFSGCEAMSKIPGTVGAAPVQNIGAYGQDISNILESIETFDTLLDEHVEIPAQDCDFSYRHSIFNSGETNGRYFILTCTFRFRKEKLTPPFYNSLQAYLDEHNITDYSPRNIRNAVSEIRANKLPDPAVIASAGSFFKNFILTDAEADAAEKKGIPVYRSATENKVNTGWLLENAGLKGKTFHGFKVSDKAALILINESAKTYADLEKAEAEIAKIVYDKYGFEIKPEPVVIKERELDD